MYLCTKSSSIRPATTNRRQSRASRQSDRPNHGEFRNNRKPSLLSLAQWLGGALIVASMVAPAQGQDSLTLGWDSSQDSAVAGYRLYEGIAPRTYTKVIDVGNATTATIQDLVGGVTYYFALTEYDTNGQESALSDEIPYTVPLPTNSVPATIAATFAVDSGIFTAPFGDSGGTLSQPLATDVTDGGLAVGSFNIAQTGNYLVTAMVIAPSLSQNTFYVNIDAEPTDPLMIWDIPVSSTLTSRTVSWRGNGNGDPQSDQYIPKMFALAAGPHQIYIRGRDANATVGQITIVAVPPGPTLSISLAPSGNGASSVPAQPSQASVVMGVRGQAGQTYTILSSDDLRTWTAIGTVTLDANGSAQFSDPDGISRPNRMYRLQSITLSAP
jgi:hypothetical protein